MKPKFQIDDVVWRARASQGEKWIQCPDCFGTRTLRVILGDGTEHTIDCSGCAAGYDPPRGSIRSHVFAAEVESDIITGLRVDSKDVEYTFGHWLVKEQDVFAAKEEAEVRAAELVVQRAAEQEARISRKERDTRTWAWHVHYHRNCIREAQKQIVYHTAKLEAARLKAKGGAE